MRALNFSFKTGDDKTKSMRITAFDGDLSSQDAKTFMETFVTADQFYKDGVKQYAIPIAAREVETTTSDIYAAEL